MLKQFLILCVGLILPLVSFSQSVDKEKIRLVVKDHLSNAQTCFNNYLATAGKKSKKEKVVIEWEYDDQAKIIKKSIVKKKTTLNSPEFHSCILTVVDSFEMQPAPKGQTISVSYPFYFSGH